MRRGQCRGIVVVVGLITIASGGVGGCAETTAEGPGRTTGAFDFGDDWETPVSSGAGRGGGGVGASSAVVAGASWSILLETFSTPDHRQVAGNMLADLPRVSPQLGAAWTHAVDQGSMVVYGRYPSPKDPAAQRDLEWIKGLTRRDLPVFPRAMLVRVRLPDPGPKSPLALTSVREKYPFIDPLYTLQVAVWGVFGSDLSLARIQQDAEAYARRLRTRGHQAYVHHDPDSELSMVTVGLFDQRAIDSVSGLPNAEVQRVRREFPEHLVNGEPVRELLDSRNPALGTRVQEPMLVLVPKR